MNKKKISRFLVCLIAGLSAMSPLIGEDVKVSAASTDGSTETQVVINPLAKYEFNDASNPGKDSMGNYDLSSVGTVEVQNGIATFNGTDNGLYESNKAISSSLQSFTLAFEIKHDVKDTWGEPIGFGFNDWTPTKWTEFSVDPSQTGLRFTSSTELVDGSSNIDGTGNHDYGKVLGTLSSTDFDTVILSVNLAGNITVYFNGVNKYDYVTPSGYNLTDSNLCFAIGGNASLGSNKVVRNFWKGQMKNVRIYNQAMTASDVATYLEKGDIYKTITETPVVTDPNEIVPVAKYEFKDSTNPGKDSMGNFDLNTKGTINVSDGAATFDSSNAMIENGKDISNKLTSFSLVFDIKNGTGWTNWAEPIGFGWDDWNATNWCVFNFESGSNLLRFTTAVDGTAADGNVNPYYGKEIGNISTTEFQRVILSVDTTGLIDVYLNGTRKYSYDAPSNFNLKNSNMYFALGQNGSWGNPDRNPWNGQLKNVAIYDFAMNSTQVAAYNSNGKVTVSDLGETPYISEISTAQFAGDATTEPLTADMTTAQMKAKLNTATAVATLSDSTTMELPLTWTNVELSEGKYYAVGTTTVVGTSTPSKVSKATVKYELTLAKDNTECLKDVDVWMNLAYKYTVTTDEETTTYSNVEFRLQLGVDSTIATKASEFSASEYGIKVTCGDKTETYAYTENVTRLDATNNIYYEIVSLGDVINNIDRASDEFTIQAYMVIDGITYLSTATKTYSVKAMVFEYHEDANTTSKVAGLYAFFEAQGLYA